MNQPPQAPFQPSNDDPSTGSPSPGEPVFLAVGRLRRPHGVRGEMVMDVLTGFPDRLRPGKTVYLGDEHTPVTLASRRGYKAQEMIVRLAGIETPEAAGQYRNRLLFVRADELPDLPEGEYYHHQLIGLDILDETGERLGVLAEILETGANDVYVLKTPDEKEVLLPAVEEVILEVNLEQREMRVRLPEWQ